MYDGDDVAAIQRLVERFLRRLDAEGRATQRAHVDTRVYRV